MSIVERNHLDQAQVDTQPVWIAGVNLNDYIDKVRKWAFDGHGVIVKTSDIGGANRYGLWNNSDELISGAKPTVSIKELDGSVMLAVGATHTRTATINTTSPLFKNPESRLTLEDVMNTIVAEGVYPWHEEKGKRQNLYQLLSQN